MPRCVHDLSERIKEYFISLIFEFKLFVSHTRLFMPGVEFDVVICHVLCNIELCAVP